MLKLFQKNKETILCTPCSGNLIALEDVKDPMFSQKLLGDGFAIVPEEALIGSPCDGTLTMIAHSAHAFGITAKSGAEILVHVGLDTVNLQGQGFEVLGKVGQKVKAGAPILKLDVPLMVTKGLDMTIPVILTNQDEYAMSKMRQAGEVARGEEIVTIRKQ